MSDNIIQIENIEQFNQYFHQPTLHPMVSVGDLSKADLSLFTPADFGMYCVVLLDATFGELILRGSCVRYKSSTIFTMKPGDVVSFRLDSDVKPCGYMLAFSPGFIKNKDFARDSYMFNDFDYEFLETFQLSENEHEVIFNCFSRISTELFAPKDKMTSHMLRLGIEQLLCYCRRYYERQLDVRTFKSQNVITKLDNIVDSYLSSKEMSKRYGLPTVAWCSRQFNLSPNYFGDLVRKHLHISAKEYIHSKILERAKQLLLNPSLSISDVSEMLGFSYSNHFTRFFRSKTGMSPSEYKKTQFHDI